MVQVDGCPTIQLYLHVCVFVCASKSVLAHRRQAPVLYPGPALRAYEGKKQQLGETADKMGLPAPERMGQITQCVSFSPDTAGVLSSLDIWSSLIQICLLSPFSCMASPRSHGLQTCSGTAVQSKW